MKHFTHRFIAFVLLFIAGSAGMHAQTITVTLAGTGNTGYSGDGASSKHAELNGPKDICMDAAQNIYFIDKGNGAIRKISAAKGVITTIAGGGSSYADGIPATDAALLPNYMCMSSTDKLYFTTGHEVRMVDLATGKIKTIAGTGAAGYTGDMGLAISATLNNPQGICIDASNNLYVVDRNNHCIREIKASTGIITTITGNGTPASFGSFLDGGAASSALLSYPVCICISPAGDIYFSDNSPNYPAYDNSVIRKISASTGIVNLIAGSYDGTGLLGTCDLPPLFTIIGTTTGMCFSHGKLYCNEMSCSCRCLDFTKDTLYNVAGNFAIEAYSNDTTGPLANMNNPYGLCVDKTGTIYIADSVNQRIRKVILLTHTPMFAYGHGLYIAPSTGMPASLDSLLWVTDLDAGQTETWSVVTPPTFGTLTGFPATATCNGDLNTTKATGLSYKTLSTYTDKDFFRVRVSDGVNADTINVSVGPKSSQDPLSVTHTTRTTALSLFPNPATSVLNIQYSNLAAANNDITITDIANRVYYTTSVPANRKSSVQINISSYPSGVYFVRNGDEITKFVKE